MWSQVGLEGSITVKKAKKKKKKEKKKASGGDGIPVQLFQILKEECCESTALNIPANLKNSAVATGLEKVSFHSNPKER